MDSLTSWILTNLPFFSSELGILVIGLSALLIILLWDWRLTLVGLMVIQIGVVVLTTSVHQLSLEWGTVQLLVTALSAAMLAISAGQVQPFLRQQRPGSWLVRFSAVILLVVSWQFVDLKLALPLLTPQVAQLFLWLAICALLLLGLSGSPFYTGVALLFWFIPLQAFIQVLLPEYRFFVLIAIVEIFVSLACSYLLLAHRLPLYSQSAILTDIAFPEDQQTTPLAPNPDWAPRLLNDQQRREQVTDTPAKRLPNRSDARPSNGGAARPATPASPTQPPTTPLPSIDGENPNSAQGVS